MKTFLISGALLFSSVALADTLHAHATSNQPATMTEAGQAYMNGMQSWLEKKASLNDKS